jgi:hypothetical protein
MEKERMLSLKVSLLLTACWVTVALFISSKEGARTTQTLRAQREQPAQQVTRGGQSENHLPEA